MSKSFFIKLKFVLAALFPSGTSLLAQEVKVLPESKGWFLEPEFYLVGGVFIILLLVIYAMGKATVGLANSIIKANKKSSATIILLFISFSAFAQTEQVAKVTSEFPAWVPEPAVYIFGGLLVIMLITVAVLYKVNMQLMKIISPETVETLEGVLVPKVKRPSFLHKVYLRMIDSVPVAREKDILLDHDYDGIKELDNNLPPWWKCGFHVTIVFGIFYLLIYHVSGIGKLQADEYKEELAVAQKQKEERMRISAENITEENVIEIFDAELLTKGKETFQKLCIACHRPDGGGQVGPNLTDEYWLHGGGINNIFKTITYGVPNKGMISWQSQLSPKQIQQVASYIMTLKGSNPVGGKEAQGDIWIESNNVPVEPDAKVIPDSGIISLR